MRNGSGGFYGTFPWSKINIGGLGYITSVVISSDGAQMGCTTDVGGAYRWSGTEWIDLVSHDTMPAGVLTATAPQGGHNFGVVGLAISDSNPLVWYMFCKDRAFRSADGGQTWANTSINGATGLKMLANSAGHKQHQRKSRVDPTNSEVCYYGSHSNGLWRYMSGSWAQIASVPVATATNDDDRSIIVAVDPTSALVGSGATSRRSRVWASSFGNGLYESIDGGDTFSAVTMPDAFPAGAGYGHWSMTVDNSGELFIAFNTGANDNLYRRSGGVWTHVSSVGASRIIRAFAFDPKNPLRFVALGASSAPMISLDDMATWVGGWQAAHLTATATDVPIIADVLNSSFAGSAGFSSFCIEPHPTQSRDYLGMGLGVCYFNDPWPATVSASDKLTLVELSKGIEELVAQHATVTPTGETLVCSHDKAIIRIPTDGSYPLQSYPAAELTNGYAVDWAIDNNDFLVCRVVKSTNASGYSSDGGRTWAPFAASSGSAVGGTIAVSNSTQIVVAPGQNRWPKYSANGGASWNDCVFSGITRIADGTENGFGFGATETRRHILCADKDVPGTFYIYNYGPSGTPALRGMWKSTDGGATFSNVNSTYIIPSLYTGYHVVLKCVEGDLYLTAGDTNSWFTNDGGASIVRSLDGGVTWTTIAGITEALIAFGKAPAGGSYPTMYMIGWYGGTYGLYRSYDKGDTIEALTTYTHFDQPWALAADPTKFGRVVVGFSGTGWRERTYNYTMRLS